MNWILELMPLFVVRRLAQDFERVRVGRHIVTVPRPGVMIEAEEKPPAAPSDAYALGAC